MVTFCCKCVHVNVFTHEKQAFSILVIVLITITNHQSPSALITRFLAKFPGFLEEFLFDSPGFENGKVGKS